MGRQPYQVVWILMLASHASGSDTRTECVAGFGGMGSDNFGFGGDGAFGGDTFGGDGFGENRFGFGGMGMDGEDIGDGDGFGFGGMEADEFGGGFGMGDEGIGGFGGRFRGSFGQRALGVPTIAGKLFCPKGNRESILVKRVKYGISVFPGTCQSVPFCQQVLDTGAKLAEKCNGGSSCSISFMQPKFLNCGRPSSYMLVEYECVDTWATYEICETVSTVARGAAVMITSPGYLGTSKVTNKGVQMCECIIQSHDKADMYMDYLQTQLAHEGDSCPYEYVLVESKRNINQSGIDKEIEVCGKQHVEGRWLQGSVRLTFASGGPMQPRGLLAKFTVDNIGNKPMIEIECGTVNANGLKLLERPPPKENTNSGFQSPFSPNGMPSMGMTSMGMNAGANGAVFGLPMMPQMPQFPTTMATAPIAKWSIKIAKEDKRVATDKHPSLKVSLPVQNFGIMHFPTKRPRNPATVKPSLKRPGRKKTDDINRRRPPNGNRRMPPNKTGAGRVVAEGSNSASEGENAMRTEGNMVAFVFAAIGAVLTLGSVGILFLHNYRKRQRIKREEMYASSGSVSSTYGKGWESASDGESIYATVADVDAFREGCVNPSVATADELEQGMRMTKLNIGDVPENKLPGDLQTSAKEDNVRELDSYDKIRLKNGLRYSKPGNEIAVIEIHQSFDSADDKPEYLHDENCLTSCHYATSGKVTMGNRCNECNISRPPRRRDGMRGYDNNVGVKEYQQ